MAYPLFQKTLRDSTPFAGTLADTSTPTPAGPEPQMGPEGPPQFVLPQTPVATEAPGATGDRERLQKIQEDRSQIQQQLQFLASARWVNENHWSRRMNLALTGNDMEPAGMMYKRYGAMSDLLKIDAQLAEEARLITTPSPQEQMDIGEASDRQRRTQMVQQYEAYRKQMGLPPTDPALLIGFVEKGYPLEYAPKAGGDEETRTVQDILKSASAGKAVGVEGVPKLGLTGISLVAATEAARQEELDRLQKNAEKDKNQQPRILGGVYKDPHELFTSMMQTYDDVKNSNKYTTWEDYTTTDMYGQEQTKQRPIHTPEQLKDARAETASHFPGYEKYFPNFVEKGFTDVPVVNPEQQDVTPQAAREELKKKVPAKGK